MGDSNYLDTVNEKDEIIGKITWQEADNTKTQIVRSVAVFLFNSRGELFLQKRAKTKVRYPLHWSDSVGGYVDSGETYEEAVVRETGEELGLKKDISEFKFLFKVLVKIDKIEFAKLYRIVTDEPIRINRDEIEEGRFFKVDEIKNMIAWGEKFSPYFLELFRNYLKL